MSRIGKTGRVGLSGDGSRTEGGKNTKSAMDIV